MSPLIYVLLVAVIISAVMQHFLDSVVIMIILLVNAVIGLIQENRAEKAMEALKEMAAPKAKVKRDNNIESCLHEKLSPVISWSLKPGIKSPQMSG
jgi:Ca2+-transporting ATPase